MNTLEAIYKRRSIRKFKNQSIAEQDLNTLLKAAMMAPTARNCQEWEFILIKKRETLEKIMQAHPHAQMHRTHEPHSRSPPSAVHTPHLCEYPCV